LRDGKSIDSLTVGSDLEMSIRVGGYTDRRMTQLGADVLQRLPIAQEQRGVGMPRIMHASASNFRPIAATPENTIAPRIHIHVVAVRTAYLFPFAPHDVTWAQKDLVGDLVLA
jgi:hypothetical protein